MAPVVEKTVLRSLFCILVVLHVAAMIYAQDDQSDFISINCGSVLNYTQNGTGIHYVSDDGFIEGGERLNTSRTVEFNQLWSTLRSFPENERNCYTLRPRKGKNNRYLIRATFFYGNYDARGQPPVFDLYIGADYWRTINISQPTNYYTYDMIHLTSSDYIYVCLVNTGHGYPFITTLELRLLDITMYKDQLRSLLLFRRRYFGADALVRYEDDKYDRIWYQIGLDRCRIVQNSDTVSLGPANNEQVPSKVMSSAITPIISIDDILYSWDAENTKDEFIIYIHLAEVQQLEIFQKREFNIYTNDNGIGTFSPSTVIKTIITDIYSGSSSYTIKVNRTLASTLPPILNAFEIYTLKQLQQNQTDDQDASAIWSIKSTYGLIKLNWQGDPCVPQAWVGLNCYHSAPGTARIISLNLSSRGLSGNMATFFANLSMIESLDLSHNNLTGNVPEFLARLDNLKILNLTGNNFTRPLPAELLAKSKKGTLWLSVEESSDDDKSYCLGGSCGNNKHRTVVISAIVIVLIIVALSASAIFWKCKRRKTRDSIKMPEISLGKERSTEHRRSKLCYSLTCYIK